MPLSALEQATLRLAQQDEGLRSGLLNLLRTARMRVVDGKVITGDKIRITIGKGGRDSYIILIEEMPGKPFKRQLRRYTYNAHYAGKTVGMWEFLAVNIEMTANFRGSMTYDQAEAECKKGLATATEKAIARAHKMWEGKDPAKGQQLADEIERAADPRSVLREEEVFYLNVRPNNTNDLSIKGKDFTMDVQWGEFSTYSPNSDMQSHDPSYTKMVSTAPASARKLYKMLAANPDVLKTVSWSDLDSWLNKAKVKFTYQFSSWR